MFIKTLPFVLLAAATAIPAYATVIDFEAQAVAAGNTLTGVPNSPLTIGIATFTGGELVKAETGLAADQTGVYSTAGLIGFDANPLTISFSSPVSSFSLLLANGDAQNTSYTVLDNLGDTSSVTLALAGSLGVTTSTVSLQGAAIRSVSVSSANGIFWNFAIDNVSFTSAVAPEPASLLYLLMGSASLLAYRRFRSTRRQNL